MKEKLKIEGYSTIDLIRYTIVWVLEGKSQGEYGTLTGPVRKKLGGVDSNHG